MGFPENRATRACIAVHYESMERAIAWIENHENDADIDDPITESGGNVLGSKTEGDNRWVSKAFHIRQHHPFLGLSYCFKTHHPYYPDPLPFPQAPRPSTTAPGPLPQPPGPLPQPLALYPSHRSYPLLSQWSCIRGAGLYPPNRRADGSQGSRSTRKAP